MKPRYLLTTFPILLAACSSAATITDAECQALACCALISTTEDDRDTIDQAAATNDDATCRMLLDNLEANGLCTEAQAAALQAASNGMCATD
jgi:hypothetical protein